METILGVLGILIFAVMAAAPTVRDKEREREKFCRLYRRLVLQRTFSKNWKGKKAA